MLETRHQLRCYLHKLLYRQLVTEVLFRLAVGGGEKRKDSGGLSMKQVPDWGQVPAPLYKPHDLNVPLQAQTKWVKMKMPNKAPNKYKEGGGAERESRRLQEEATRGRRSGIKVYQAGRPVGLWLVGWSALLGVAGLGLIWLS